MIDILDPIPLINENEWSSWTSLKNEYGNSYRKIDRYSRQEKNKESSCKANLEIASSIKSDLRETIEVLEKKCLYEYNTMNAEDIKNCNLTERQNQIAMLKQKYSITEISKLLNLAPNSVFYTYKQALYKIDKYLKLKKEEKATCILSDQQRQIYLMLAEGKNSEEIIVKLGITRDTLKTQKKRINKKLGGTKL